LSLLIPKIWSDAIMKQFMAGMSAPKGFRRVFELVCWTKSIGTEEMKEALACLVMMGRTRYALIRSFGP
jgi:hypothetical protein